NPSAHVVLRGGTPGPNQHSASVRRTLDALGAAALPTHVVIDLSHGNSARDYTRQPTVAREVAAQIAAGEPGIVGVMAESFIVEGRQEADAEPLVYGQSITDACIGWDSTVVVLREIAEAVRARRGARSGARSADSTPATPTHSIVRTSTR